MPTTLTYELTRAFAQRADAQDPLQAFRAQFLIPAHQQRNKIYFCGNSLGLQPRAVADAVAAQMQVWAEMAVDGHFHAQQPWWQMHRLLGPPLARLVGAQPQEVVAMNSLTVNLHLMLASFYRPTPERYRILTEAGAFPSDAHVLASQVAWHGLDPDTAIVELAPRAGEDTLRTEDILDAIAQQGQGLALVMLSGVQYYTGQYFDLPAITAAGHRVGATVGFDLAHAVGNVPLHLHDWNVDFAVWCTYKYLNAGPGSIAGAFVHARHAHRPDLPRLAGWWGHDEATRFQMKKDFVPMPGAEGWQLSNAPVLLLAAHQAALDVFEAAGGMEPLVRKSRQLTGFLEALLLNLPPQAPQLRILTPADPGARGCQLSLLIPEHGRAVFDYLTAQGVVGDWREPDVIRVAPTPLYNTFEEVFDFAEILGAFRTT